MPIVFQSKAGMVKALTLCAAISFAIIYVIRCKCGDPLESYGCRYRRTSDVYEKFLLLRAYGQELQNRLKKGVTISSADVLSDLGCPHKVSGPGFFYWIQIDSFRGASLVVGTDTDRTSVLDAAFDLDNALYRQAYPVWSSSIGESYIDIRDALASGKWNPVDYGFVDIAGLVWIGPLDFENKDIDQICRIIENHANAVLKEINKPKLSIRVADGGDRTWKYNFSVRSGCLMSVMNEVMVNTGFVPTDNFDNFMEDPCVIMRYENGIVDPETKTRNKGFGFL